MRHHDQFSAIASSYAPQLGLLDLEDIKDLVGWKQRDRLLRNSPNCSLHLVRIGTDERGDGVAVLRDLRA